MIRPPKLKPGDRIAIIAPARKIDAERLQACCATLKSWGLEPVLGPNLYAEENQYAGSDELRQRDLQWALDAPDIQAVLCARGGYGTLRIIDGLTLKGLKKHPKWVIGFSDITALLFAIYNEGIESLHAPMGISFDGSTGDAASIDYLRRILMETGTLKYSYTPNFQDITRTGQAVGRVLAGNLSIISQLLGTQTDFKTDGTIFFLEDLSEYLYHIDRMMVHLKRGGKLEKPAAIVIGGMTEMKDNDQPFGKNPEEIVADAVGDSNYPLCFGFPFGHWPQNYPLVVGREAELRVSHTSVELIFQA